MIINKLGYWNFNDNLWSLNNSSHWPRNKSQKKDAIKMNCFCYQNDATQKLNEGNILKCLGFW